ncbi:hypothetical protein Anapl_09695 [Anas platyrhynchos]|uniref:Uncharacterized protein n=1 Tax=Anas platyrhynchos TaxID=8839 RepID=R0JRH1_ANAPL|nr:hypothetical protein Anapl_09695 [Anas platyrhynchos]
MGSKQKEILGSDDDALLKLFKDKMTVYKTIFPQKDIAFSGGGKGVSQLLLLSGELNTASWALLNVVHNLAGQSCGELGTIPAAAGAECAGVPNHEKRDSGPEEDRSQSGQHESQEGNYCKVFPCQQWHSLFFNIFTNLMSPVSKIAAAVCSNLAAVVGLAVRQPELLLLISSSVDQCCGDKTTTQHLGTVPAGVKKEYSYIRRSLKYGSKCEVKAEKAKATELARFTVNLTDGVTLTISTLFLKAIFFI